MKFRKDLPESGPSNYLKLKDKESVVGVFRGDIFEFFSIWENGKQRVVDENTYGARFRFKINIVIKEGASYVVKVFENSKTVYEQLGAIHEEYDLTNTLIKITRTGTGKSDTVYTMMPMRQEITPEAMAHIKTLPLIPLETKAESVTSPAEDPWANSPPFEANDEIPF